MKIINCGHRGASANFPENTLTAFRAAIQRGATAIELDVWQCQSGELVVIHDKTVDRTTNGHGNVTAMALAQLQLLDAGRGETIPTLQQVLQVFSGQPTTIFIEIKGAGQNLLEALAQQVTTACNLTGYTYAQLPLICFTSAQLRDLKKLNGQLVTGLSAGRGHFRRPGILRRAKRAGVDMINPRHSIVTPRLVRKAHERGLRVNTWAVNDPKEMLRLAMADVDCIMTDRPDVLAAVLAKHETTS